MKKKKTYYVCVHLCVDACVYIYMHTKIHTYEPHTQRCTYVCAHMHIHTHMHLWIHISHRSALLWPIQGASLAPSKPTTSKGHETGRVRMPGTVSVLPLSYHVAPGDSPWGPRVPTYRRTIFN